MRTTLGLMLTTCATLAATSIPAHATTPTRHPTDTQTGEAARVATLGNLFGPTAAADALTLLGQDLAQPARPVRGHTQVHRPGGHITTVTLQPGQDVEMQPGYAAHAVGIPADPSAPADTPTATLLPGDPQLAGAQTDTSRCPVQGPVSFTDTWGAPRSGGRTHEGTDMFATTGTPVVTLASGVITVIDPVDTGDELGGITVSYVTATGDRWYNAHLHAVAPALHVGDYLPAGALIGEVGNTGDAAGTPPHLHIEWHPGGGAAAPDYSLLDRLCP